MYKSYQPGRSEHFNEAARVARPESDTPQVRVPLHPEGKWAYDRYSGKPVSRDEAEAAGDNPLLYKHVEWR